MYDRNTGLLLTVLVRVRPFTSEETSCLLQTSDDPLFLGDGSLTGSGAASRTTSRVGSRAAIRKVINVVDDRMLIFDPPDSNPMMRMQKSAFPTNNTARIREHRFVFDRLFDETAAQEEVYSNTTRPLLDSVLDGYNATVFAYGATGCGKTHTISGNPQAPGIIFLTMKELFERIAEIRDTKLVDVSLSYLEIYNETIRDLLEPSNKQLVLREDTDHRISVSNLSSHKPENVEAVMDMILQGNQNRTVSPTEANATSSRSHAVLQINVVQKGRTASISQAHTFATLSIIDLAGSERASATKNRGERLIEGANINKSLLALGNCINALCDPRRRNHVPYRDSKLTRLLKFSLGGNCKTVMIVCVSPSSKHYDETLNTLKYADRAKKIKTKVIRNEHNLDRHVGSYLKMITEQKAEIEELRNRESKAVGLALANAEKSRIKCLRSLDDAMESLRATYGKTAQAQESTCKTLKQLRNIINQINQVESILRSFEVAVNSSDPPLTETIPAFTALSEGMKQALEKLNSERVTLEGYCKSVTKDKQIRDTALATLVRRLEDTPGWTDADRVSFGAQAEALRLKSELEMVEQVAGEPIPTKIMEQLSSLFFTVMAKIGRLGLTEVGKVSSELNKMTEEVIQLCHSQFDQILGNYNISTSELCSKMGLSSILASTMRRGPSESSLQRTLVSSPARSGNRRVSIGALGSAAVAATFKHAPPARAGRLARRQGPGSAKKQVVVKSPMRNHRKAVKRVRWEDDGEICLDPPTTPSRKPKSSVKSTLKKKNLILSSVEDDDSLPSAPDFLVKLDTSSSEDSEVSVSRVLSPVDKMNDQVSELASLLESATLSPPSPPRAGAGQKFGVKGELRRKSGSSVRPSLPHIKTSTPKPSPSSATRSIAVTAAATGRSSPQTATTGTAATKLAPPKTGKENTRPASPDKGIPLATTTRDMGSESTPTVSKPAASVIATGPAILKAPSPVTAMRASPVGHNRGGNSSLGAPARLSAATASSASKHVSQR